MGYINLRDGESSLLQVATAPHLDAGLCRGVVRLLCPADKGRDGRDRNDGASLWVLVDHLVGNCLCDVEAPVEVDPLDALPELVGHVEKAVEGTDPGVREEYVDAAKLANGGLDDPLCRLWIRNITIDEKGTLTELLADLLSQLLGC